MPPALEPPPRPPWGRVLAVLAVIGAAHLGLFLLLTAGARKDVSALEGRHGAARLEAAEDPGARPHESGELPRWLRDQRLWEASRIWSERSEFVSLLGYGLLLSFLVQAGILGVLLFRSTHAVRRHT